MADQGSRRAMVAAEMRALFEAPASSPAGAVASGRPVAAPPPRRNRLLTYAGLALVAGVGAGLALSTEVVVRYPPSAPTTPPAAFKPAPLAGTVASRPAPAAPLARSLPAPAEDVAPPVAERADTAPPPPLEERFARRPRRVDDAGCEGAECLGQDMAAADDALREAYADAVDAGVDHDRLLAARDRWERLRARSSYEPGRMIDGYSALAERLTRQAQAARDGDW